ncbi:MAG: AAA family ATPase, partial [Blastocatellia bacterium]
MIRTPRQDADIRTLLNQLTAVGEGVPTVEEKVQIAHLIRSQSRDAAKQVDEFLIDEATRLRAGLNEAQFNQEKLQAMLDKLTAPPWHPAIFLGLAPLATREAAMVLYSGVRRVVTISDDIDPYSLAVGDEVLLGDELNVVVDKSPYNFFQSGETVTFHRYMPDRRLVIKHRDEEVIVDAADALAEGELKPGDLVRWDRHALMAFEKVDRSKGAELFLEETPRESFENIGGLDRQIEELQRSIRLHLYNAETARRYQLRQKGSVLLVGPPGTGKTMMARALANWLGSISKSGRARFINIKPGGLHSMWYSQSEANYREAFRVAREAGEEDPDVPVVMFFDEVDALGASRGHSLMRVDDRVLTAFMTELDGLDKRGNVLVIGATNRRDAIDPALLRPGRLGDLVLEVPRPNMKGAREIFRKHFGAEIPYAFEGLDSNAARREIIEGGISRIYAPNADSDVVTLTFRDGKRRIVQARELISGANIEKIALSTKERACVDEIESGQSGVRLTHLLPAIAEELESISGTLTPANCRNHLTDLPQDVDVVRVERIQRKVSRP